MASNVQKTPLAQSLNRMALSRANTTTKQLGKTLPCSVIEIVSSQIVKVKFEVLDPTVTLFPATMPVFGPEYVRYPIQVGSKGMAIAADAFLGQMSGLGTGIASLNRQPNLSALMFMPFGNTGFSAADLNTLVLYGASNGTKIMDSAAGNCSITLTSSAITLTFGAHSIVINASGVTIDGRVFLSHEHSGVSTGASNTGGVV